MRKDRAKMRILIGEMGGKMSRIRLRRVKLCEKFSFRDERIAIPIQRSIFKFLRA